MQEAIEESKKEPVIGIVYTCNGWLKIRENDFFSAIFRKSDHDQGVNVFGSIKGVNKQTNKAIMMTSTGVKEVELDTIY